MEKEIKKSRCWHHRRFDTTNNIYAHEKLLEYLNTFDIDPKKCKITKTGVGVGEQYDLYYTD